VFSWYIFAYHQLAAICIFVCINTENRQFIHVLEGYSAEINNPT